MITIKNNILGRAAGIGVALSLILLMFTVLTPSATSVKVSAGVPDTSLIPLGSTISFSNVELTIRAAEAIPVNFLTFEIYDSTTHQRIAWVRFTLAGVEMAENPPQVFTVENETDISQLPYQMKGNFFGYDEETGNNVTGFHHGFGYGYGYGNPDVNIVYTITFETCTPGTYYAKLLVKSTKYTYISGETSLFTVQAQPPKQMFVNSNPKCWLHPLLTITTNGAVHIAGHTLHPSLLPLPLFSRALKKIKVLYLDTWP